MQTYKKINENKKFCNETILEEVAEDLGLPIELIKEVTSTNSKFYRSVIETGAFESVTMPYLGKLKARPKQIQQAFKNIKRP